MSAEILVDCGAYPIAGPVMAQNTGRMIPGPFNVERVHWTATGVFTNTTPLRPIGALADPSLGLSTAPSTCLQPKSISTRSRFVARI
ncbi:MAG: molybdopterin cofactor-binding domain-containing protein [Acidimicrobiales bacterium]